LLKNHHNRRRSRNHQRHLVDRTVSGRFFSGRTRTSGGIFILFIYLFVKPRKTSDKTKQYQIE